MLFTRISTGEKHRGINACGILLIKHRRLGWRCTLTPQMTACWLGTGSYWGRRASPRRAAGPWGPMVSRRKGSMAAACGRWGGSDRNICSALLVQYRGDAAVDAGMPRGLGGGGAILGKGGGQQLPRLHTAASGPATPGKFVSTTPAPFLCQNWQRRLAVCE